METLLSDNRAVGLGPDWLFLEAKNFCTQNIIFLHPPFHSSLKCPMKSCFFGREDSKIKFGGLFGLSCFTGRHHCPCRNVNVDPTNKIGIMWSLENGCLWNEPYLGISHIWFAVVSLCNITRLHWSVPY